MCLVFLFEKRLKLFFTTNLRAAYVACVFFPQNVGVDAHIFTFAIFAGAFMMRICGGLLFGYIGDKFGRKIALLLSILLMAISTTSMGCLPSFASVGFAAPIMLLLVRLCQGLSVGGQVCFTHACTKKASGECKEQYYIHNLSIFCVTACRYFCRLNRERSAWPRSILRRNR